MNDLFGGIYTASGAFRRSQTQAAEARARQEAERLRVEQAWRAAEEKAMAERRQREAEQRRAEAAAQAVREEMRAKHKATDGASAQSTAHEKARAYAEASRGFHFDWRTVDFSQPVPPGYVAIHTDYGPILTPLRIADELSQILRMRGLGGGHTAEWPPR